MSLSTFFDHKSYQFRYEKWSSPLLCEIRNTARFQIEGDRVEYVIIYREGKKTRV